MRLDDDEDEIEHKCKGDDECKAKEQSKKDDERRAQEVTSSEQSSQAEEKRKKGKERMIEEKCGSDGQCKTVEHENEKAREKLDEQDRKQRQYAEREKKPGKPNLRPERPQRPAEEFKRSKNVEIDIMKRYRSTHFDPQTGQLKAGDLVFHPSYKSGRFASDGGDTVLCGISKERVAKIYEQGYEPWKVLVDGKWTGKTVFHRFDELIQQNDASWLQAGDHSFKMKNGDFARDGQGNIIPGGKRGEGVRTAQPVPRKNKVQFADRTDFKVLDEAGNVVKVGNDDTFTVPDNDNRVGDDIDWQEVKDKLKDLSGDKDKDDVDRLYHPRQQETPHRENPTRPLQDGRTDPFSNHEGNPRPSDPDGHPRRIDEDNWPPSMDGTDETGRHMTDRERKQLRDRMQLLSNDEIKELKQGKLGRPPSKASYPRISSMSAITKIARSPFLRRASALSTRAGKVGWIIFFGTQGAAEFLMFSQAKGDAGEWWHCTKERIMLWEPHDCGMVDVNGNRIEVKDRGPFMNFVYNFYGPLLWEDIDGDGDLESPFTKFIATMQDLGDAAYDFFDSSEDGTGFVENSEQFVENGVKTMVNVGKGGWKWYWAKVEKVGDWIDQRIPKVGARIVKASFTRSG